MGNSISNGRKSWRLRPGRLPISKKLFVAAVSAVLAISLSSVAAALISGSTGSVIRLSSPPASVKLNALQHKNQVHTFDERQGVTLASALTVDAVNSGSYAPLPPGGATIAAGTKVDSHLIHSDIPSYSFTTRRIGSVDFATDILGVIGSTARLAASDAALGAPGTLYAGTTQWRGVEPSGEGGPPDKLTISADRKKLSFDLHTLVMDEIRVVTSAALSTTITDTPDPVEAGSNVTYTITVTNSGAVSVPSVQVKDSFPGATFVSATPAGCVAATSSVTCPLGTIAAGGSAVATVTVTSPSVVPSGGTITNTAMAPPVTGAPVSETTTVIPPPSLSTTVTDSPQNVTVGNNVQYTLTVKNIGTSTVNGVQVVDTLPADTTVVLSELPANCTNGSGTVTCTLGNLVADAEATVQFVAQVPNTPGDIVNSAVASPGPSNVPGTVTTIVEAEEDGVTKGYVLPGGSLTIPGANPATLTLPNTGAGAPVEITQGTGTFCPDGCTGPYTEISPFEGYSDAENPIKVVLTFSYPNTNAGLTQAAFDFGAAIVYKDNGEIVTALSECNTPGQSNPGACVDGRTIEDLDEAGYETTFTILYLSGDPRFAKR